MFSTLSVHLNQNNILQLHWYHLVRTGGFIQVDFDPIQEIKPKVGGELGTLAINSAHAHDDVFREDIKPSTLEDPD